MKTKLILLMMISVVLCTYAFAQDYESFSDLRDGKTYQTVKIGHQIWMAENLNFNTGNSWCYGNNSANCIKYGRLYDWSTANEACPDGWHLPSTSDFEILFLNVGDGNVYMLPKKTFEPGGISGFNALLGGESSTSGNFRDIDISGNWWSSSEAYGYSASYFRIMNSYDLAHMTSGFRSSGFSVRCVKNVE